MLNIIRGRAGSGKTALLFELIEKALNEKGGSPVLIVPEQFSFVTERELLRHLGAAKTKRVTVTSFSRLAKKMLKEHSEGMRPSADDGIKAVFMKKTLDALEGRLNIFKGLSDNVGSLKSLTDFNKQFKLSGAAIGDFEEFYGKSGNAFLNEKLKELLLISEAYDAVLSNSFFDDVNALKLFNESEECTSFFEGKTVFADSFRSFSSPELNCLIIAAQKANETYITFCGEKPAEPDGAFEFTAEFEARIVGAAKKSGVRVAAPVVLENSNEYSSDISHIEKNIYTEASESKTESDGSVKILKCKDKLSECRAVACEIKKLLRSGKYRCRDIVIIERVANSYKKELIDTLLSYGIPVFNDSKRPLEFEALFVFCSAALDCITDSFSTENIMRYLKSSLSPLTLAESSRLEKYALVWGINGKGWTVDFTMNPEGFGRPDSDKTKEELSELNELRKRAILPLLGLKGSSEGKSGKELSEAFFDFITRLGVSDRLFEIYSRLDEEGFPEEADRVRRSWGQLVRILDDLTLAAGEETLTLKKWYEYFKALTVSREVGEIPQGLDEVTVGSADRIRTSNVRVAFLVGVNREEFPLVSIGNGILSDRDRTLLFENGIELRAPFEYAVKEERFIAYCALTAATEKLFLSYRTLSADGATDCSSLISDICELLPGVEKITVSKMLPEYRIESDESAFRELSASYAINDGKKTALLKYFEEKPEYKGRTEAIERLFNKSPLAFEDKRISTELFGKTVGGSASRVEDYYKCPFRYFCRYGIKLKSLEKAELDPRQNGTAIHYVLEQVLKHYGFKELTSVSENDLRAYVTEVLDSYIEENMGGKGNKTKRFMFLFNRLIDIVMTVIERLRAEFSVTSFEPVDFELKIGEDIPAYKLPLENGSSVITGSVDRVDMMERDGITYLRVIDYKTGKKDFNLSVLLSGLNIQPVLYLMALLKNGEERYGRALPAGVLYLPSRLGIKDYLKTRNPSEDEVKSTKRAAGKLSGMILSSPVVLNGMGAEIHPDFLPAGFAKDGETVTGNYYTLPQFFALSKIVDSKITEMGNALHDGNIEIMPSVFKNGNPCEYCDYRAVCEREDVDPVKELMNLSHSDVLEILDEEAKKYDAVD